MKIEFQNLSEQLDIGFDRTPSGPLMRFRKAVRDIAEEAVNDVLEHSAGHPRAKFEAEREETARRFRKKYSSEGDGTAGESNAAWGERTRTCKRHFEKTIEMSGEFSLDHEVFGDLCAQFPRLYRRITGKAGRQVQRALDDP